MAGAKLDWSGVIPAATTQFDEGLGVDLDATQKVQDALISDGVDGIIVMGTVGENNSLRARGKARRPEGGGRGRRWSRADHRRRLRTRRRRAPIAFAKRRREASASTA